MRFTEHLQEPPTSKDEGHIPAPPGVDPEDVRLLGEIGVSAVMRGMLQQAVPIFTGLAEARPDHALGPVGLALCAIAAGKVDIGLTILRSSEVRERRGGADARGILLFALAAGNRRAEALEEARRMQASEDPQVRKAARIFLADRRFSGGDYGAQAGDHVEDAQPTGEGRSGGKVRGEPWRASAQS